MVRVTGFIHDARTTNAASKPKTNLKVLTPKNANGLVRVPV